MTNDVNESWAAEKTVLISGNIKGL